MEELVSQPRPSFLERLRGKLASVPRKWRVVAVVFLVVGAVSLLGVYLWGRSGTWESQKPSEFLSGLVDTEGSPESGGGKTVAHPITGLWFTPSQAAVWKARRPVAVLINNHADARSVQTGISKADLVYEAVAEGGIPRLLAIFHTRLPQKVGSVRSARVYFVDWAREYDAWLAHWGAAQIDPNDAQVCFPQADAFSRMREIYVPSIDAMTANSGAYFRVPNGLAYEHTGFANLPKVLEAGYKLYPDQRRELEEVVSWKFKEDAPEEERGKTATLSFDFWEIMPGYDVAWKYDPVSNTYLRSQGGTPIKDAATGQQITAKNVVVLFMSEASLGDLKQHLLYETLGEGSALVYRDGQEIEATWERGSVGQRTRFKDANTGREIEFNRGPTWLEVLPVGNEVVYRVAVAE